MKIRKNFVDLNDIEKGILADGFRQLKNRGTIDAFKDEHVRLAPIGIHFGPAFLPWHRHFILRLENELQSIHESITLPFWDLTREDSSDLEAEPWKSFFGGRENKGGLIEWNDFEREQNEAVIYPPYTPRMPLSLKSEVDLLERPTYESFRSFEQELNGIHVRGHRWVGKTMAGAESPADPLFYLLHCNIDRLWAFWQINHRDKEQYNIKPANIENDLRRAEEAFVKLEEPMPSGNTPLSMLNHYQLGYDYPKDDRLEEFGIITAPNDIKVVEGKVTSLIVQDVGIGYSTGTNYIDGEVVITLDKTQDIPYGFTLRNDRDQYAHQKMLSNLLEAYKQGEQIRIEFKAIGRTNRAIFRVTRHRN